MNLQPVDSTTAINSMSGLSMLPEIELDTERRQMLESAAATAGGTPYWKARKIAEARDLLALSQLAPRGRMKVELLDLDVALRAVVFLRVPVPLRPSEAEGLRIGVAALLGLTYRQEALRQPMPGFAHVHIISPREVWHANVADDPVQPLCLGARLPAGIRAKELILMSYGALAMQSVMIDEGDAAGVLNCTAAKWWQSNLDLLPLSSVPFLGTEDLGGDR